MKERPILFSAPMVRAILEGRKTQTRRIVKPQPHLFRCREDQWFHERKWTPTTPSGKVGLVPEITMPYYVGDRLWVRETWRIWNGPRGAWADYTGCDPWESDIVTGSIKSPRPESLRWLQSRHIEYLADSRDSEGPWRPSIFMPRWASRITLEVTDVRVQRLQYISEDDAIAEGIWECESGFWWYAPESQVSLHRDTLTPEGRKRGAVDASAALWDSINGKRPGCAWKDNPFVWAVSFRRVAPAKEQSNA